MKKEKQPKLSRICSYGICFQGTQERVQNSQGKRAISVRATAGLLYKDLPSSHEYHSLTTMPQLNGLYHYLF